MRKRKSRHFALLAKSRGATIRSVENNDISRARSIGGHMTSEDWAQVVEEYNTTYKKKFKSIGDLLKTELARYTGHRATLIRRLGVTRYYLEKIINKQNLFHLCIDSKKGTRIFWDDVLFEYNERHGTNVKSDKNLLETLYHHHKNIKKVASTIFISWVLVYKRMIFHNIERSPRGGTAAQRRSSGPWLTKLRNIPDSVTSKLTTSQLADRVGCAYSTMSAHLRRGEKPFTSGLNARHNSFACIPEEEHNVCF